MWNYINLLVRHKVIALVFACVLALWGVYHAPFNWDGLLPHRDPLPVDAVPDVGENQQIVFTDWMGKSAAEVENNVTRPLAAVLMGVTGARTVRGSSMSGMSSVYVIFDPDMDFHESRSRIMEKLAGLPPDLLPDGIRPALGPDASPLGQVFWYTLEGVDPKSGRRVGGWTPAELREIQDTLVRSALQAVPGIAEVATIAPGTLEYRIELDADKMRAHGVTMSQVYQSLEFGGADQGVGAFELNGVNYSIRSLGAFHDAAEIDSAVIRSKNGVPVRVADLGRTVKALAPAGGGLDRYGEPAVGAVAVVRQGENPMAAIAGLKAEIARLAPSLPRKTLPDGSVSQITVSPFYDRSGLIGETLHTLSSAIRQQILITAVVIILMLINLQSGLIVSLLMPMSVLICFILMRLFKVDANLVSLSGIAIAVGTISDMGIILCENIGRRLGRPSEGESSAEAVVEATREVGGAVLTAVLTTIVGFLPVFALSGAEGNLFKPLAYTKTFCLLAAIVVTLSFLPPLAHLLLAPDNNRKNRTRLPKTAAGMAAAALFAGFGYLMAAGAALVYAVWCFARPLFPASWVKPLTYALSVLAALTLGLVLAGDWRPLGTGEPLWKNTAFTWSILLVVYGLMELFIFLYPMFLGLFLRFKKLFLLIPVLLCLFGLTVWMGFDRTFSAIPAAAEAVGFSKDGVRSWGPWVRLAHAFPGLGKEFMPSFDEGTFLYMPTVMPHASQNEAAQLISIQNRRFESIPEVREAVGKFGRAESALDPAPLSMFETIINYDTEFIQNEIGEILTFAFDPDADDVFRDRNGEPVPDEGAEIPVRGRFLRDENGELIQDAAGRPFRQWRPRIKTVNDLWKEIEKAGVVTGVTGAPRLYPIEARMVMLQTGIRAPMGIKIQGSSPGDIQKAAEELEKLLRQVPAVNASAVAADRTLGRPYWEIIPKRDALAAHGITVYNFGHFLEVAIAGSMTPNWVYADRNRIPIRPVFEERFRRNPETLASLPVPKPDGSSVPLGEVASFVFAQGPDMIASEGSQLVAYVVFDRTAGVAEVTAVEAARDYIERKRASGAFVLPDGVTYSFTGSYENQVRSEKVFAVILPAALIAIFLLIYMQFRSVVNSLILFSGVPLALAGGMILLWLYGQDWFLGRILPGDLHLQEMFHVRPYNLSVAVWVGFLALFGIATDDGVVMATYLEQSFATRRPADVAGIRATVMEAGLRRVRPCLMTTATTILALLPVLTSGGKGSEIMIPMAIPSCGGMLFVMITMFVVPVCYAWWKERGCRG